MTLADTSRRSLDPAYTVGRVSVRQRLAAAKRLVSASGGDANAARRLLDVASDYGVDLTHLWASFPPGGGTPRQVCLAAGGTGRTASFFTTAPADPREESELAAVIAGVLGDLNPGTLAQVLLEPHERGAGVAFRLAGFQDVGSLAYMRRPMPRGYEFSDADARPTWPAGVRVRRVEPGDDAALITAMNRSYERTLDCPELCGLRDTRDVLASHRATGSYDPDLWWIVELDGAPEGCMLLSPCGDQGSVELVYLGLSPAVRGKGLGAALLKMGLAHLRGRAEQHVTCAVDERNQPARRLYARLGFVDTARRIAMVKPVRAGNVEKPRSTR